MITHQLLTTVSSNNVTVDITHHTRNSADADKPCDASRGQSRSPNMVQHSIRQLWFPISVL